MMEEMAAKEKNNNVFSNLIIRRKYYQYATKEEVKLCIHVIYILSLLFNFISTSVCMFPRR
jgi:hypothetical protein